MSKQIEYNGIIYSSITKLARAHGVLPETLNYRIKKGLSLKEALNPERIEWKSTPVNAKAISFAGKHYKSISALCREYNVDINTFRARIKCGMSMEDALDSERKGRLGEPIIFEGKEYISNAELCRAYNVDPYTFYKRRSRGYSLKGCIYGAKHK